MKGFILLFTFFIAGLAQASSQDQANKLLGTWGLAHYIYNDQILPVRDSNMALIFKFENKVSSTTWYNKSDKKQLFCNRKADYSLEGNQLFQKVTWIDPENTSTCSEDPDMVFGSQSESKFKIVDSELHLYVQLSNDWLIYVFERVMEKSNY